MNAPDLIVLHEEDNVGTALKPLDGGFQAGVAGIHGALPALSLPAPIPFGHKAALQPIPKGSLVVKHGHAIGRATVDIAEGEHVHTHNVISLSRDRMDAPV